MERPVLEDARGWLAFVADASKALSETLDLHETLRCLVRLTVPRVADWCQLTLLDERGASTVDAGHRDSPRAAAFSALVALHPEIRPSSSVGQVLRSGRTLLCEHIDDPAASAVAAGDEALQRLLREVGTRSVVIVPLVARGRVIGAIGLGQNDSDRRFSASLVPLVEDLASRAALAIEHARLFAAEKAAREKAERTAEELRVSEERLRGILDSSTAGIFMKDVDDRYIVANKKYAQILGLEISDILGKTRGDLFPPDVAASMLELTQPVYRGESVSCELDLLLADGVHTFFNFLFPLFDRDGAPNGYCCVLTDITEAKRAREALRHSEDRFARVFRASPIAIAIIRARDGVVLDCNPRSEVLTGYSMQEQIGRTAAELNLWARPEDRPAAMSGPGAPEAPVEAQLRHRSGRQLDVLLSIVPLVLDGQDCRALLALDVTELKRLERELRQTQKLDAIGRLAGGIAHDFNNLLTAIGGYSEVLLTHTEKASLVRESAEHIRRCAARAAALTSQLLVFGRRQVLHERVLDLNQVLREMKPLVGRLIGEDIVFEVDLEPGLGSVSADPDQLEVAILNLALNSRDAMPRGGRIRITTRNEGPDQVLLTVADTGCGMSKETRARLFEPFFTTKEVGKGTGLGLATVYGVVQRSGGEIEVDSELGHGTTIRIRWPRVADRSERAPAEAPRPVERPGSETILFVEDDEDVRDFARFVLARDGYTVLTAADGDVALEIARTHPAEIHLLLCDVVMPHLNGPEVVEQLLRIRPATRVLHVSGYPGDTIARYGGIPRDVAFLQKPFTVEQLLRNVRDVLRR